jgi:hypothetical protein
VIVSDLARMVRGGRKAPAASKDEYEELSSNRLLPAA